VNPCKSLFSAASVSSKITVRYTSHTASSKQSGANGNTEIHKLRLSKLRAPWHRYVTVARCFPNRPRIVCSSKNRRSTRQISIPNPIPSIARPARDRNTLRGIVRPFVPFVRMPTTSVRRFTYLAARSHVIFHHFKAQFASIRPADDDDDDEDEFDPFLCSLFLSIFSYHARPCRRRLRQPSTPQFIIPRPPLARPRLPTRHPAISLRCDQWRNNEGRSRR